MREAQGYKYTDYERYRDIVQAEAARHAAASFMAQRHEPQLVIASQNVAPPPPGMIPQIHITTPSPIAEQRLQEIQQKLGIEGIL